MVALWQSDFFLRILNIECTNNKMRATPCYWNTINAQTKGTKLFYRILTNDDKSPNCCAKWEIVFGEKIDWKRCFTQIQKIDETKLKWFQLRVINRILATNVVLKEMGVLQSNLCRFCNLTTDRILHCLWDCPYSQSFWNELEVFLRTNCLNAHNLKFSKHLIIFGFDKNSKFDKMFDFILDFAKFFIYQSKCEENTPNLFLFRKRLKRRYEIELYNQKVNMTSMTFKTAWACYYPLIRFEST